MSQREKTLLLVGAVLVACSLMLSEWLVPTDPQPARVQLPIGQAGTTSPVPQDELAFNLSASERTMALTTPRNIFAPLKKPVVPKKTQAPPLQRPAPPPPRPPRPVRPPRPTGPSAGELAAKQAEQDMRQYQFFGYLTKGDVQQGFLRNGQNLYIVQQGERVKEDVEIKLLTPTAVVLSKHVKEAGRTVDATLPLTQDEQDAL